MSSQEREGADSAERPLGPRSLPLRLLLGIVHAGSWMTGLTLPRMRPRMRLFMKGLDAAAALRVEGRAVWKDITATAHDGRMIPVRLYRPESASESVKLPIVLYFHGGGFALGDHTARHRYNRAWCVLSGCMLLSVGYRLAPEHPYPAGVEDAYDVLKWASIHASGLGGDGGRIAVAGESAGGNIAAVTALLAKERGGPDIACQALLYPAVDLTGGAGSAAQPSLRENGRQYMLTLRLLQQFASGYAPEDNRRKPAVSPLLADTLEGLPPALVVTAELDPLRDQGHQYAERLRRDGVAVEYRCYAGMIHDFTAMMPGWIPAAGHSLRLAAAFVRRELAAAGSRMAFDADADLECSPDGEESSALVDSILRERSPELIVREEGWS
ncbi:alpha/beta hydrolase [Paenibacillus humicus]|uniref:alpha/beta hydrolase n=1 Tax=Paenibacillus humicus TaxID=412861 RepID=UPI003F156B05